MNRAERRAAKRCKHTRTRLKDWVTRPATDNGQPAGVVRLGQRECLDCGRTNPTPVRMN
ncbi:hypothetical protein SEA_EMIANNA_68 [Gordonia phage Emianna]|uniref:Uncharacterized protein n=3 Tax=Foxborovirus TaxID=2948710 RepID=A0A385UCI5_9CAUD|nr:hypothetical protein KNU10_gp69 [Gordonia phage Foxboro]YP_010098417.1 hypothetical protein KNU11_gp69 [Gordonia phage KidneyBean]YP_010098956.1 hypothetical protein KNU15_gp68 [Gordonia phage Emianna]AYD84183.1 hypothetical protein SEA_JIFALL16_68 [Gordonia phage Jifall16]AYD84340.1 hypothetical protein SEA_KURT_68 [Gordonia phage Kurt]QOP66729.1 hypothetical protein SEA_NOVUMREGINA_68 [Gordonia phage NovumRegina]QOR55910.1 hypothetical protein SEA_GROOTJR_70 [Gordonia phage GrootJr]WNM6